MSIDELISEVESGREELGMSWKDIAAKCGVAWQTVHNWKKNGASPKLDTAVLLLGAVGKKLEIVNI